MTTSKKKFATIEADQLDAVSGGWSLGGYVSGSVSGFGASRSVTVDSSGNIYTSTGSGPTFPGIGVSAGGFYSNGTPQDHFAGDGLNTTVGAGKVGVEVGSSASGHNLGVSLGVGVSPINSAETSTKEAGHVSDYGGGTPDPTAYDAMGNYTGVGTGTPATETPTAAPTANDAANNFATNDPDSLTPAFDNHDYSATPTANDAANNLATNDPDSLTPATNNGDYSNGGVGNDYGDQNGGGNASGTEYAGGSSGGDDYNYSGGGSDYA